jgi:hypothetical protein
MNAFESLMAGLMEREGFWVRSSYKVNLTPAEKRAIGRPSCPRWELDLIAYRAKTNELRIVECKSYLDSPGVRVRDFNHHGEHEAKSYKLFNSRKLFGVISRRLVKQLLVVGACRPRPHITLSLAAGKIRNAADAVLLKQLFGKRDWLLFDPLWIRE